MKYRVKIVEKVFFISLIVMAFFFYKSPGFFSYVLVMHGQVTIPALALVIIVLTTGGWWLETEHKKQEEKMQKLKQMQKDIKFKLLSQMDPLVVEAIKEIVRKDMKSEFEQLRNSDRGCSPKCNLIKQIADTELARNQAIVKKMLEF